MRSFGSKLLPLVVLVLLILATGCSIFDRGSSGGSVSLVTIEVTPATASLARGTTRAFSATGIYSDQATRDLTASVAWSSRDTTVATISSASGSAGVATGIAEGATTVTATLGAITGSAPLTVTAATLVSIGVTPALPSLAKGTTQAFTATGIFTDASTQDLTGSATWSSSDITAATISNVQGSRGVATGVGVNTTTISATVGPVSGSTTLTVTPAVLVSIGVTPAIPSIAKGTTQAFAATGIFSDASIQDLTASATWSSSDTAVATISNAAASRGLATGVGVNATTIQASYGGVSGATTLTVTPAVLVAIRVTPGTPSIAKGTTQQFTATGTFTDAQIQDLTESATWSSSDTSAATISNAAGSRGKATGTGVSPTTITAVVGTVSGSATLTVTPETLVSIAVTAASASIAKGTTLQFTAKGTFTDASIQDLTDSATWTSSDTAVATISNAAGSRGKVKGADVGSTTITAAVGPVSSDAAFSVTPATLVSIAVTPALPMFARATTYPFTATGTYTDASTQDLTAGATWYSSDPSTIVISNALNSSHGRATGLLVGPSTIKAVRGGVEGSTLATVCTSIVYPDTAAVSVSSVDLLVAPGMTVIIDGSALTGSNTLTWNGAAETDGAFYFKAGSSTAVLTGGNNDDTFDFTTPGVAFASTDQVDGKGGANTLKIGQVASADALANLTNIQTIAFANNAPISITTADGLVPAGATLTVDASALSGIHTFTWNGAAESDGMFRITGGASAATITGGSGNDIITGGPSSNTLNGGGGSDTINGGSGGNIIDGGPGSDIINLGAHTGADAIHLNNLLSGADTINGFVPSGLPHDVIYVAIDSVNGPYFVTGNGVNVMPGNPAVVLLVTASGSQNYDGGTNTVILADSSYRDGSAVIAALGTGGSDAMVFSHVMGPASGLLVAFSDGTDAHLGHVNLNPRDLTNAGSTSSTMVYTELAKVTGFAPYQLADWLATAFHF